MRRMRKAKIVATLGPASSDPARIRELFEAGADVFRLNFSHGVPDDHRQRVDQLRALEKKYNHPIAILMDLQGPKLRLGVIGKQPMELKKGQKLRFDMDPKPATAKRIPLLHPEIFAAAKPGGLLLIDDGKVRLKIVAHDEGTIDAEVEVPGQISDRKGVNLPNLVLPLSPMTPKDRKDLERPDRSARPRSRGRLGGAFVRPACPRHRRTEEAGGRPRRGHGQAREAGSDRPSRRDHRAE